jgi:hypothetical protein
VSEAWRDWNRAWWDERVPFHLDSALYDRDGFVGHPAATTLRPFEADLLGDVTARRLVHLQCHTLTARRD